MKLVIENLANLSIKEKKYNCDNLWENFLKKYPYKNFYEAFKNKDWKTIKDILFDFKRTYIVEFSSPEGLRIKLLNDYNDYYKTNIIKTDNRISNISNFGMGDTKNCNKSENGNVVHTLSIRYYFTYLLLSEYIKPDSIILEIGCCSPVGVSSNILKYKKETIKCLLLCDLLPVLLISYCVLVYNFPNLKILFYNQGDTNEIIEDYDVVLITPELLYNFDKCKIEFCFNSYSFSEMSEENLNSYFNFLSKTTKYLISENKNKNKEGNFFKSLNNYIPSNFEKIKSTKNCNCPDGYHDIMHYKINSTD